MRHQLCDSDSDADSDSDSDADAGSAVEIDGDGITDAALAWIRGTGHDFATEQPDRTSRMMMRFLED